jgi:hypothetical protein
MGQLAPHVGRARIHQRSAGVERPHVGLRRRLRKFGEGLRCARDLSRLAHSAQPPWPGDETCEIRGHIRARSRTAFDVSLGQELFVCGDHRRARKF